MSQAINQQGILLESGTNEMELLEFYLRQQSFGVNVAKIRQLMPYHYKQVTRMVGAHPYILGTLLWQGHSIPLIDLNLALGQEPSEEDETVTRIVLVTEFNGAVNGFLVDGVNRIHRINWNQMQPAGSYLGQFQAPVNSTVTIDNHDILLVDLEHVTGEIAPVVKHVEIQEDHRNITVLRKKPEEMHLLLAEDSVTVQAVVLDTLSLAGFTQVSSCDNGGSAFTRIQSIKQMATEQGRPVSDFLDLVITDIEMPQMDGLTLCKRIKTELGLDIPVIIFSSLVNETMALKCKSVHADANVSKADTVGLIETVDQLLTAA
jgi:two-component system chemotaxis response regulator CheV